MEDHHINIPIYVSTNNKHTQCLRVFAYTFHKFLPHQELRILGYDIPQFPLPPNCTFISMGTQGDVNEWSTDLRNYFLTINDEFFIYGTEDTFIYRKPQIDFINYLIELIRTNQHVGRINLVDGTEGDNCDLTNSPHYKVELLTEISDNECGWGSWELYKQKPESNYSLTTQLSIWNKEFLLRYMVNGLTPWEFEGQSHKACLDPHYNVLMVHKNFPIYKKEGYSLGTWTNEDHWFPLLDDKAKLEIFNIKP